MLNLDPIFDAIIAPDAWEPHMALMRDFWSSIVLGTARYKGNPLAAHARIPDLRPDMFETWLRLFRETAYEIFDHEVAALFCEMAGRIAESFQVGLFSRPELDAAAAAQRP
jgi:hemoglobin